MRILIFVAILVLSAATIIPGKDKDLSLKKMLTKYYSLVPSGNAIVDGDTVSVQAFYIYNMEVTNFNYLEFLYDLKSKGDTAALRIAQIDSVKWNSLRSNNQAYVNYYHGHPAYRDYPVVNITHEGARLYCRWLGEKYDIMYGTKGKFVFRLMEKAEYIRASRGDSETEYSWKTNSLFNTKGQPMCNFTRLGAENIHRNSETGQYEIMFGLNTAFYDIYNDLLAPSESYWPNEFGIYNLNGNAAEMIATPNVAMGGSWQDPGYDVRIESERKYAGADPRVGFRVVITATEDLR